MQDSFSAFSRQQTVMQCPGWPCTLKHVQLLLLQLFEPLSLKPDWLTNKCKVFYFFYFFIYTGFYRKETVMYTEGRLFFAFLGKMSLNCSLFQKI